MTTALKGEAVDPAPVNLCFHFPEDQRAEESMGRSHLQYYLEANLDSLKVMNDNYDSPPYFKGLSEPSDRKELEAAPLASQRYQDQLSGLWKITGAVGDEVPVITTLVQFARTGNLVPLANLG